MAAQPSLQPSAYVAPFVQARDIAKEEIPDTATTVLLGECTHGTEEFYRIRAELTKYLIEVRGFKIVLCEADWPFLWHANQYIHRKRKTMFPCEEDGEKVRFPDWMWRNQPFVELIEWMRKRASSDGPFLFGMDCYCKDESKEEVMKFLDRHDKDGLGKAFRRTCFPEDVPEKWPEILSKLQWEIENEDQCRRRGNSRNLLLGGKKFRGCTKLDQFNCEQNINCMISADEYYTKQRLEPPGSRASWNARDQHMMTVILALKGHSKDTFDADDVKIVVWAHNSHVGDASSTPSGGRDFTRNEKWNLGQMCRNTLHNVFVLGFYSYHGTVRAAEKWGGDGQVMDLRRAMPNSLEHHLHEWFPNGKGFFALGKLVNAFPDSCLEESYVPSASPLNIEYCALHNDLVLSREKDPALDDRRRRETHDSADDPEDLQMMQVRTIRADPREPFVAVRREVVGRRGTVRLFTDAGYWITEYMPHGSQRIHCLPKRHLDYLAGPVVNVTLDKLCRLARFPLLQRWVGVQYHPETEIQSHYGEIVFGKCYDLVLFVDKTEALDVDIRPVASSAAEEEESSKRSAQNQAPAVASTAQTNKRLLIEYRRIMRNPIESIEARPLDSNILEWHFVLTGCQDPYTGGKYHGILEFPEDFPMKPPSIKMLTPSGRFEVNKRICLSMSDFHSESWNPSWTVEKILIGLMSFMYEESTASIGSILESYNDRKRYAAESEYFNVQNEIYCELFCADMQEDELKQKQKSRKLVVDADGNGDADSEGDENACRFCLMDSGDLVSPCACSGTGRHVHVACLRQWQKSVILTQPTHPKYQTQIDAVCNICETPFKDAFKPVSRREVIMEYLKDADDGNTPIAELIRIGNLLVSSRPKSNRNFELMELTAKGDQTLNAKLGHFTQAVYLITMYDKQGRRGGGSVLAVNIEQRRRLSEDTPLQAVEDKMPMMRGAVVSPLRVWQQRHVPLLLSLFGYDWYARGGVRRMNPADSIFDPAAIEHYVGGPVEPACPLALAEMANFSDIMRESEKFDADAMLQKYRIKNDVFFGDADALLALIAEYVNVAKRGQEALVGNRAKATLKVYWGYASWDGTQLLGEIARCGWGLTASQEQLGMQNGTWEVISNWEQIVDTTAMAKESEYSRS